VAGDHYPLGPAEFGPSDDDIAVSHHIQMAVPAQRLLHSVGDLCLVSADGLDVDQRSQQLDDIATQIQRRRHERHLTASVGSAHD
jgi:hypothetical protein